MVCPAAMVRYLSCGATIAAWKSIECIIGAATTLGPGTGSSLRLVMTNLIRSPTRARTVGPGTWSPKVQALNFTPGAISMILCVVSSRTVFTGEGSSGFSSGPKLSAAPSAKAPLLRSAETLAGVGLRSILEMSYGSGAGPQAAKINGRKQASRGSFFIVFLLCEQRRGSARRAFDQGQTVESHTGHSVGKE